jgi:hypothetical protein
MGINRNGKFFATLACRSLRQVDAQVFGTNVYQVLIEPKPRTLL